MAFLADCICRDPCGKQIPPPQQGSSWRYGRGFGDPAGEAELPAPSSGRRRRALAAPWRVPCGEAALRAWPSGKTVNRPKENRRRLSIQSLLSRARRPGSIPGLRHTLVGRQGRGKAASRRKGRLEVCPDRRLLARGGEHPR